MDEKNKFEAMQEWLAQNPGKTDRDWLLDVRCTDDNRCAMRYLLEQLDKAKADYGICVRRDNYYRKYQSTPLSETDAFYFDFAIAPKIGRTFTFIEADMPAEVLGVMTANNHGEEIPEQAYLWLLKKWYPDFNPQECNELHKLLWQDMPSLFTVGSSGFLNWQDKNVVDEYIAQIKSGLNKRE